jgi:hypothetical protein
MSNRFGIPEGIFNTIVETLAVYRENKAEGFSLGPPDDTHELYLLLLDKDLDEDDKDEVREMIDLNEACDFLTKSDLGRASDFCDIAKIVLERASNHEGNHFLGYVVKKDE